MTITPVMMGKATMVKRMATMMILLLTVEWILVTKIVKILVMMTMTVIAPTDICEE